MLKPEFSGQFKRDYKLAVKRGCDPKKLETVITMLCAEQPLPAEFRDHALTNSRNYKGMRVSVVFTPTGCLSTGSGTRCWAYS